MEAQAQVCGAIAEKAEELSNQYESPQHQHKRLSIKLSQNGEVCVWKADLTTFGVDAVVNAANVELKHSGGLAHALSKAGGPQIQNECNQHISDFGPLKTGETIVTNAGNLNCGGPTTSS